MTRALTGHVSVPLVVTVIFIFCHFSHSQSSLLRRAQAPTMIAPNNTRKRRRMLRTDVENMVYNAKKKLPEGTFQLRFSAGKNCGEGEEGLPEDVYCTE